MPTRGQTDEWVQRMDAFRAKLKALHGHVPARIQQELLEEFEQLMNDMQEAPERDNA